MVPRRSIDFEDDGQRGCPNVCHLHQNLFKGYTNLNNRLRKTYSSFEVVIALGVSAITGSECRGWTWYFLKGIGFEVVIRFKEVFKY